MRYMLNLLFSQMGFWITWALIPIIVEIIPSFVATIQVIIKKVRERPLVFPDKLPMISIIVPIYNSADTLFACLQSIHDSSYPLELMQIILADNGSQDDSFAVFNDAHNNYFNTMNMHWVSTDNGKANALNTAMYECIGTYIMNIDSDGRLEKNALLNMILQFENDSTLSAMTGTILTQKEAITQTKKPFLKLLQKNEYFEYGQAFLSGRSAEANHDQLFTMAGAFSAFRKEVLFNTYMYDTDTVGEDTDMTFQIRHQLNGKVGFCANAIFYVDPIDGLESLYIQRQRWQRGEIEVSEKFMAGEQSKLKNIFKNFLIRRMIIDHTFVFPKMIWMFASIVLAMFGYSPIVLLLSYVLIYFLYTLISIINFFCVRLLLKGFKEEQQYYSKQFFCILTLPFYTFICSWIRLVGIINTMMTPAKWNSVYFKDELQRVKSRIKADIKNIFHGGKFE